MVAESVANKKKKSVLTMPVVFTENTHFLELRDSHDLLWSYFLFSPSGLKKVLAQFFS